MPGRGFAPRASANDWGKAFLCSAGLVIALLLLLWFSPRGEAPAIEASGAGVGGGIETSSGAGEGPGTGASGEGPGAGLSGSDQGTESPSPVPEGGAAAASEAVPSAVPTALPSPVSAERPPVETPQPAPPEPTAAEPELVEPPTPTRLALLSPVAPPANPNPALPPASPGIAGRSGGAPTGKKVGGMFVKGQSLGVILDVSGSMTEFLPELRREIQSQFPDAVFLEVTGCSLHPIQVGSGDLPAFGSDPTRYSTMGAILELVDERGVDSVYWFCDLQDHRDENAIHALREKVAGGPLARLPTEAPIPEPEDDGFSGLDELKRIQPGSARPNPFANPDATFHLYVRSVGQEPDPALQRLIDESGGAFELRR